MPEIRTVTALTTKSRQMEAAAVNYGRALDQARADLTHVNACIAMFEVCGEPDDMVLYINSRRLFKRAKSLPYATRPRDGRPLDTRELAHKFMLDKRLDIGDKVLAKMLALKIVHALRQQE